MLSLLKVNLTYLKEVIFEIVSVYCIFDYYEGFTESIEKQPVNLPLPVLECTVNVLSHCRVCHSGENGKVFLGVYLPMIL